MRNGLFISNEERESILQKHNSIYNGYATNAPQSNMTPLTVYDPYRDKKGITVNSKGEVKEYQNHKINEIAAKNLHYDEIDPAYEFDSKGPSDPFYGGGYQSGDEMTDNDGDDFSFDMEDFEDYLEQEKMEGITESVNKTFDMFRRIKKFN